MWNPKLYDDRHACRHLEYDQHPEAHVYIIAQKVEGDDRMTGDRVRLRPGDPPWMYDL